LEDIRVLAFFYIIQAALMGFVGMALIGVRLSWKQVLLIGLMQGIVVYLCRGLCAIFGLPFGTHSFISFLSLIVLFRLVLKMRWGIDFAAASLAFITVMLSEGLTAPVLYTYAPHVFQNLDNDVRRYVWLSYCSDWLLIVSALFLGTTKYKLMDFRGQSGKV